MLRALLPLLLACGISAAAPPAPADATPQAVPGKEAAPSAPAKPAPQPEPKPAKDEPAQKSKPNEGYRALIALIVMGTIALRHARSANP